MGQPLSMLLVLFAGWGGNVRAAFQLLSQRMVGQLAIGTVSALLLASVLGVTVRVRTANAEAFSTSRTEEVARQLTRINDTARPLAWSTCSHCARPTSFTPNHLNTTTPAESTPHVTATRSAGRSTRCAYATLS